MLVGVFIVLFQIGARHADSPYIVIGQVATALYFSYFLILVPVISSLENSLVDLNNIKLSPALQLWQGKGQNFFAITITSLKNNLNLIKDKFWGVMYTILAKIFNFFGIGDLSTLFTCLWFFLYGLNLFIHFIVFIINFVYNLEVDIYVLSGFFYNFNEYFNYCTLLDSCIYLDTSSQCYEEVKVPSVLFSDSNPSGSSLNTGGGIPQAPTQSGSTSSGSSLNTGAGNPQAPQTANPAGNPVFPIQLGNLHPGSPIFHGIPRNEINQLIDGCDLFKKTVQSMHSVRNEITNPTGSVDIFLEFKRNFNIYRSFVKTYGGCNFRAQELGP